jgi:hypothetical protein
MYTTGFGTADKPSEKLDIRKFKFLQTSPQKTV